MEKAGSDRLSTLADDILVSILCHVDGKTAAQTSVLSKRWMNLWAKVPVLDFEFKHLRVFRDEDDQNRFLENYLSRRDDLIKVSKLNLSFQFPPCADLPSRIILYAIRHQVEDLYADFIVGWHDAAMSFNIFNCTTLTRLVLVSDFVQGNDNVVWDLPNLRTLYSFFPPEYGSKPLPLDFLTCLPNLTTLGLSRWHLPASLELPNLTSIHLYAPLMFDHDSKVSKKNFSKSLTLSLEEGIYEDIVVEAPYSTHLSVIYPVETMIEDVNERGCKLMISAPRVRSFSCVGFWPFMFEGLLYLDNVEIKLDDSDEVSTIIPLREFEHCRRVVTDMLLALSSAKVLSLDFNILKVLSELDSVIGCALPRVFRNLKYLKVPESYEKLCNLRPSLRAYVLGFSTDANIITEFPKKGVEEVECLKKEISDLESKTRNIMGKARHFDLEDLKQLEQILNEGLVSVTENKERLLKAQLDSSEKKVKILHSRIL